MEGLRLMKEGSYIGQVTNNSTIISLLESNSNVEVMLQTVFKDRVFYLYPSDNPKVFEFIYILSGQIEYVENGRKTNLKKNDYFSAKNIKKPILFEAKTDVSYLWIITEPTFHHISEDIENLRKLVLNVESKDKYTYNHGIRVANYSVKIASKLNFSKDQMKDLYLAAELHDIGKINIPLEILQKPGKLTKEEFDIIKKHSKDGADIVSETSYKYLADIIEQHHERLNGSGYPNALKEDEILLPAKIIGVADTFDAMTEDRAYRKAFSAQFAMEEIKGLTGTHYDINVVEALESVLKEEGKIE
ncbi:HD domain-containing phosphohydrolase [Bacillus cihuensis]|uniref:HD domain-containing phosphohydrolase n=1 Tax=Bacillus cihuensis TaxID=1208599 RepID=UPI0003F6721E|nr:HD domain-containing phosphohydrolase [Bacillus cihuensis]